MTIKHPTAANTLVACILCMLPSRPWASKSTHFLIEFDKLCHAWKPVRQASARNQIIGVAMLSLESSRPVMRAFLPSQRISQRLQRQSTSMACIKFAVAYFHSLNRSLPGHFFTCWPLQKTNHTKPETQKTKSSKLSMRIVSLHILHDNAFSEIALKATVLDSRISDRKNRLK